jgi:hypothetical protein
MKSLLNYLAGRWRWFAYLDESDQAILTYVSIVVLALILKWNLQ